MKMKKLFLGILLSLVLLLGLMPGMSLTAYAATNVPSNGSDAGNGMQYYVGFSNARTVSGWTKDNNEHENTSLFDGNGGTKICGTLASGGAIFTFEATQPFVPKEYFLRTGDAAGMGYSGRSPKSWTISASKDNKNWTQIASVSNDTTMQASGNTAYKFSFENPENTAYQYFKFCVTEKRGAWGSDYNNFELSEFYMAGSPEGQTPIPQDKSAAGNGNVYFADFALDEYETGYGYQAYDDCGADKLFDKTNSKLCAHNASNGFTTGQPYWINFHYNTSAIIPNKIFLRTGEDTASMDSRNPIAWVLKAKAKESDGWTEVLQVTNANMEAVNHRAYAFDINNQGSYQYFRIEFTEVGAPEGDDLKYSDRGQTIQLSELYMSGIEVPVASVATVKKAPAAKTLTYNGQPQELITAGEADGGDMKYAVTTENKEPAATAYNFDNTSIPTATDAGT